MRTQIAGAWDYRAAIGESDEADDGRKLPDMFIDEGARVIQISPAVVPSNRLPLLIEGFAHAFTAHVGRAATDTGHRAQLATFTVGILRWLSINGGEAALLRLGMGESPQAFAGRMALAQSRWCAVCQQSVAPGLVEWMPDPARRGMAVVSLYCDGCSHLQTWRESVGENGLPTAQDVSDPEFDKGAKMRAFLRRHPGCGVVMVD